MTMLMDDHDDDDDDADDEAADRTMIATQMTSLRWGSGYALLPDTHQLAETAGRLGNPSSSWLESWTRQFEAA